TKPQTRLFPPLSGGVALRIRHHLISSGDTYGREFIQANTFWFLTRKSLMSSCLLNLCRTYDQEESKSLNLKNLLDTIKANLPLFAEAHFRERLSNNAFVDSLASTNRIPTVQEIEQDLELTTDLNPLVKKLIIWRNNIIAHRSSKVALGKNQILEDNPISHAEITELLKDSLVIFDKYSGLYRESRHSVQIVGHDDYLQVLKYMKAGIDKELESYNT
ncbi:MAG: hypothetical protein ACK53X_01690, partial [Holosporales bacterium]